MGFFQSLLHFFVRATSFAQWSNYDHLQQPLPLGDVATPESGRQRILGMPDPPDDQYTWPVGKPFNGCQYPHMAQQGWSSCNSNRSRDCWLDSSNKWSRYNIHSDFDYDWPMGIIRKVWPSRHCFDIKS